jgi:hypothetical protein
VRGFESKAFSGTMIKAVHGEFYVLESDVFEAHFFGKERPNEAVHVLVGAAFPGGVGMSEGAIKSGSYAAWR